MVSWGKLLLSSLKIKTKRRVCGPRPPIWSGAILRSAMNDASRKPLSLTSCRWGIARELWGLFFCPVLVPLAARVTPCHLRCQRGSEPPVDTCRSRCAARSGFRARHAAVSCCHRHGDRPGPVPGHRDAGHPQSAPRLRGQRPTAVVDSELRSPLPDQPLGIAGQHHAPPAIRLSKPAVNPEGRSTPPTGPRGRHIQSAVPTTPTPHRVAAGGRHGHPRAGTARRAVLRESRCAPPSRPSPRGGDAAGLRARPARPTTLASSPDQSDGPVRAWPPACDLPAPRPQQRKVCRMQKGEGV